MAVPVCARNKSGLYILIGIVALSIGILIYVQGQGAKEGLTASKDNSGNTVVATDINKAITNLNGNTTDVISMIQKAISEKKLSSTSTLSDALKVLTTTQ